MGINNSELITELREHLGLDEDELPNSNALVLLNRSFWEILNHVHFKEKERLVPFTLAAGVRKYKVPATLESIESIAIVDPSSEKRSTLDRMGEWTYDNTYQSTDDAEATPTHYYREENYIVFSPTPEQVYTVELRCRLILQDLGLAGSPNVPQEWHEIILDGAISRGFRRGGDYKRAKEAREFQASVLNTLDTVNQKEQIDSHKSHFEVLGYDEPQV